MDDKVLILLPIVANPLQARYHGPYIIEYCVDDVNYVLGIPDRRKQRQQCHVNMFKSYHTRDDCSASKSVAQVTIAATEENSVSEDNPLVYGIRLNNCQIISNLKSKLGHLSPSQTTDKQTLIQNSLSLFPDVPSRTDVVCYDVDVGTAEPVKQHPYRVNPEKQRVLQQEVEYMLENDLIERSHSAWSSPCILVFKADKTLR